MWDAPSRLSLRRGQRGIHHSPSVLSAGARNDPVSPSQLCLLFKEWRAAVSVVMSVSVHTCRWSCLRQCLYLRDAASLQLLTLQFVTLIRPAGPRLNSFALECNQTGALSAALDAAPGLSCCVGSGCMSCWHAQAVNPL